MNLEERISGLLHELGIHYDMLEHRAVYTVAEARAYMQDGQFEAGTMLPKIEAAVSYLEAVPEGSVLITSLDFVAEAIKGKAGTVITA